MKEETPASTPQTQEDSEDFELTDPEDFGPDIPNDSTDLMDGADLFAGSDDETEFYKTVNADSEMIENAKALKSDDHHMVALMGVLQTLRVAS